MPSLFAGIYLQDKPNEFLPLNDIDFDRNVNYLKEEIAKKVQCDATNLGKYAYTSNIHIWRSKYMLIMCNTYVHMFKKLQS